jgi:hypothetical protein
MKTTKLIKIDNCGLCPHSTSHLATYRCKRHNRQLDNEYFLEIPNWCTLYDAEPTAEERKEAFKKILKRTIEDNKDLLKELEKL